MPLGETVNTGNPNAGSIPAPDTNLVYDLLDVAIVDQPRSP